MNAMPLRGLGVLFDALRSLEEGGQSILRTGIRRAKHSKGMNAMPLRGVGEDSGLRFEG